jgi:hypothetical protein
MRGACLLSVSASHLSQQQEENEESNQHRKQEQDHANGKIDHDDKQHPHGNTSPRLVDSMTVMASMKREVRVLSD